MRRRGRAKFADQPDLVAGFGQHPADGAAQRAGATSDLIATLPRHIGETLARAAGLRVLPCPFAIPGFTVKQYWHARYHHDAASRWLRGIFADLFMKSG